MSLVNVKKKNIILIKINKDFQKKFKIKKNLKKNNLIKNLLKF